MANYAYIDSQNLNVATHNMGWNMDWAKFRAYLKNDFNVEVAYLFIGYMPEHQDMYSSLQKAGYIVVFKPVTVNREGEVKGNIDADLVLQAMMDFDRFDEAVIVSGDGDFSSLISHLANKNKLASVLVPNQRQYSSLLKQAAKDKVTFLNNSRRELEYKRYNNRKPSAEKPTATPEQSAPSPETKPAQPAPSSADKPTKPAPTQQRQHQPRTRRNGPEDSLMQAIENQTKS